MGCQYLSCKKIILHYLIQVILNNIILLFSWTRISSSFCHTRLYPIWLCLYWMALCLRSVQHLSEIQQMMERKLMEQRARLHNSHKCKENTIKTLGGIQVVRTKLGRTKLVHTFMECLLPTHLPYTDYFNPSIKSVQKKLILQWNGKKKIIWVWSEFQQSLW